MGLAQVGRGRVVVRVGLGVVVHFSNGAQPKHVTDLIDNTFFSRPPPEYLALDGTSSCEQRRSKAFPRSRVPRKSLGKRMTRSGETEPLSYWKSAIQ